MPPQQKTKGPSGGGSAARYVMPSPPPIVVWRDSRGSESAYAAVTKRGQTGISVMIFPPDARVGIPKEAVRYIGDPAVALQPNSDSGVWDYTDESKLIRAIASVVVPGPDGNVKPISPEMIDAVARLTK